MRAVKGRHTDSCVDARINSAWRHFHTLRSIDRLGGLFKRSVFFLLFRPGTHNAEAKVAVAEVRVVAAPDADRAAARDEVPGAAA